MLTKLRKPFCICLCSIVIFSTFKPLVTAAQDTTFSRPPVIDSWEKYNNGVKTDSTQAMVELKTLIPNLEYDLRYASLNNFMHRLMYPAGTKVTFLRRPAARQLQQVQTELATQGFGLKIFDAYRPYAVTVLFWELVKDERYVANPSKGSGHNRGIAVDLTIIDLETKKELDMGTGFDNFTDSAHLDFKNLSADVLKNRNLLRSLMEKHGFVPLETEWWHYYLPNSNRFDVLDIPFTRFQRKQKSTNP